MITYPYSNKITNHLGLRSVSHTQLLDTGVQLISPHITFARNHYTDVIMSAMASQITSVTIVYSTVYSDADQTKHHSSASLAFVQGIHRGPVDSPHKWPVTRKIFPFDDVIMFTPTMNYCDEFRLAWNKWEIKFNIVLKYGCQKHEAINNGQW